MLDLEAVPVRGAPPVEGLFAEDVALRAGAVEHADGGGVPPGAQDGVQGLDHGGDPGAADDHAQLGLAERVLRLHVEGDVLEVHGVPDRHAVHVLRELALGIDLDHQLELPQHRVGRDRGVGPDDGVALVVLAALGEDARAGGQAQRLRRVTEAEGEDAGVVVHNRLGHERRGAPLLAKHTLSRWNDCTHRGADGVTRSSHSSKKAPVQRRSKWQLGDRKEAVHRNALVVPFGRCSVA